LGCYAVATSSIGHRYDDVLTPVLSTGGGGNERCQLGVITILSELCWLNECENLKSVPDWDIIGAIFAHASSSNFEYELSFARRTPTRPE
jgi:hypothetical protein